MTLSSGDSDCRMPGHSVEKDGETFRKGKLFRARRTLPLWRYVRYIALALNLNVLCKRSEAVVSNVKRGIGVSNMLRRLQSWLKSQISA